MNNLVVNNRSGMKLDSLMDSLNQFYPYSKEKLGFDAEASFNFVSDPKNGEKMLGKTAYYDPNEHSVTIYVDKRHPKDILRSISHELVHHAQNCRGDLSNLSMAGEQGYAQKDSHLREMEREAYEKGNMIFRDWEDGVKAKNNTNETIYKRLVKDWGYGMLKESNTKYQRSVRSKHAAMKTRINKSGANKTKASPFDKGSSSKRAKSAPPSAGSALEENGEKNIMDEKLMEDVVRNILKRMALEESKPDFLDLDKDGDKKEPMKSAAADKSDDKDDSKKDDKDDSKIPPQLRKHVKKKMEEGHDATPGDAAAEILKAVEVLKQMGVDVPPDIQARIEQMAGDPEFAEVFGKVKADAMSGTDVSDPEYRGNFELEEADDEKDFDLDEGYDDEDDDKMNESKKSLKHKLKKARRQHDKKTTRRIKKHLNESESLKEALVRRKGNINQRLMSRWFENKE